MNIQETYLLKLIQKVEHLEKALNNFQGSNKSNNELLQRLDKAEIKLTDFISSLSTMRSHNIESIRMLEELLKSVPKSIPRSFILKIERGSAVEIVKSFLILIGLCSTVYVSSKWIEFNYFDKYKNAWESVYEDNNESTQHYLDQKLNEFKSQSFWEKITNE